MHSTERRCSPGPYTTHLNVRPPRRPCTCRSAQITNTPTHTPQFLLVCEFTLRKFLFHRLLSFGLLLHFRPKRIWTSWFAFIFVAVWVILNVWAWWGLVEFWGTNGRVSVCQEIAMYRQPAAVIRVAPLATVTSLPRTCATGYGFTPDSSKVQ